MKVSAERMSEIIRIRDAALAIIEARGIPEIMPGCPFLLKQFKADGLEMKLIPIFGHTLDIWDDCRKVMSVAWNSTRAVTVTSFHPGPWQARI